MHIFAVGSSLHASESDEEEAVFRRGVDSLVERYGCERILQRLLNSRGVLLQHNWCMQLCAHVVYVLVKLDCTINCHCVQMSSYIHHVHINLRCSLLYMSLSHAGPLPAGWGSPPPPTCHPVQRQCSGRQLAGTHYCPQETVGSDEDQVSPDTPESDMYRS